VSSSPPASTVRTGRIGLLVTLALSLGMVSSAQAGPVAGYGDVPEGPVAAAEGTVERWGPVAGYGDVPEGRWYTDAVQWSADNGIGAVDGACFRPDKVVSRGEAALWIYNMARRPAAGRPHSFSDVTDPSHNDAISWMAGTGITTGTAQTAFAPDEPLTRAQAATLLHRLAGEPSARRHGFADVVKSWQQAAVSWAARKGITVGTSQTAFSPDEPTTRAQLVTFLYRYSGKPAVTVDSATSDCPESLVLGFGGDLQLLDYQIPWGMLDAITDTLSAPDLMFANLETVVGTPSEVGPPPINKSFNFLSPPEAIDQIVAAGIDVVGMANNHTWDYGPRGAASTRRLVDDSVLVGTGAGATQEEAYAPVFVEVAGRVIGVVSLTTLPCGWSQSPTAQRIGVAWACDRFWLHSLYAIATAEARADLTVVMLHSGWELTDCPTARQREIINVWIEVGADVVSISHPHQLQGVEVIDGAAVLWSTGNLAFQNGGFRRARSAVFEITISESVEQIRLIPHVLPGGVTGPASPEIAQKVFAEVSERTVGGRIDSNGILVPDSAPSICDY